MVKQDTGRSCYDERARLLKRTCEICGPLLPGNVTMTLPNTPNMLTA